MPSYNGISPEKKPPVAKATLDPDMTPAPLFHKTAKPTFYRTTFSTKASGFRLNLPNHQNNNQTPKTARTINTNHRQAKMTISPQPTQLPPPEPASCSAQSANPSLPDTFPRPVNTRKLDFRRVAEPALVLDA